MSERIERIMFATISVVYVSIATFFGIIGVLIAICGLLGI